MCVALRTEIESYAEFQLPCEPSVGAHCGKQSTVSSNETLRMITFIGVLPEVELGRMSSHAPRNVAFEPMPKIVVFAGMRTRMRADCADADATRARSSGQ